MAVPVTTYFVVANGVATGLPVVALLSVVAGDQLYCIAPEAVSWLWLLLQSISFDFVALTIGNGITVTAVDNVLEKPQTVSLITTEYTELVCGVAKGFWISGLSNEAAGCHV